MAGRFPELNRALCELVEDYSLVGYELLNISDKDSVARVAKAVDRANGYVFGGLEPGNDSILLTALRTEDTTGWVGQVQERYIDAPELYDDWDKKKEGEEEQEQGKGESSSVRLPSSDDFVADH